MNSFMIALGLASIMFCIGTFLRAKIGFLRNMLVPASVIVGTIRVLSLLGSVLALIFILLLMLPGLIFYFRSKRRSFIGV